MTDSISLLPLHHASAEIQSASDLYVDAFPPCERRDVDKWLHLIDNNKQFTVFGIYSDGNFQGFISCWEFAKFVYVEHFAVNSNARGNGIGAKSITAIKDKFALKPFVLEVEPPCDDLTQRRVGFYQRQGFVLSDINYSQPPYRKEDDWFELKLMSTDSNFLEENSKEVIENIYQHVYNTQAVQ